MMKRTTWSFDLHMKEPLDFDEYSTLVRVMKSIAIDAEISGECVKTGVFQITIEAVEVS